MACASEPAGVADEQGEWKLRAGPSFGLSRKRYPQPMRTAGRVPNASTGRLPGRSSRAPASIGRDHGIVDGVGLIRNQKGRERCDLIGLEVGRREPGVRRRALGAGRVGPPPVQGGDNDRLPFLRETPRLGETIPEAPRVMIVTLPSRNLGVLLLVGSTPCHGSAPCQRTGACRPHGLAIAPSVHRSACGQPGIACDTSRRERLARRPGSEACRDTAWEEMSHFV